MVCHTRPCYVPKRTTTAIRNAGNRAAAKDHIVLRQRPRLVAKNVLNLLKSRRHTV